MNTLVQPATDDDLPVIVDWLRRPEIAPWLDFGGGQPVTAAGLKLGRARGVEKLFTFSSDDEGAPLGVVGLSQVHRAFRTAMLWYALGATDRGGRGLTTQAVASVLEIAFDRLELDAVNAWAVETNRPSVRVLEKTGFQLIGRQRRCHRIGDQTHDRLLFDRISNRFGGSDD